MAPRVTKATASRRGGLHVKTKFPRRRTSVIQQAKRRKSAAAQSRQIQRVARLAIKNATILRATRTYTDWVSKGATQNWLTGTWRNYSLMDPATWTAAMRQNDEAEKAQTAFIRKMYFQYVVGLNTLTRSAAVTLFLVSIRNSATNFIPTLNGSNMTDGDEYQTLGNLSSPVLNANIFNVKWVKSFTLMSNSLTATSVAPQDAVGDPDTTYVRGFTNISLKTNLKTPSVFQTPATGPESWKMLLDNQIRPTQRLYLMAYFNSADNQNSPGMFWALKTTATTTN